MKCVDAYWCPLDENGKEIRCGHQWIPLPVIPSFDVLMLLLTCTCCRRNSQVACELRRLGACDVMWSYGCSCFGTSTTLSVLKLNMRPCYTYHIHVDHNNLISFFKLSEICSLEGIKILTLLNCLNNYLHSCLSKQCLKLMVTQSPLVTTNLAGPVKFNHEQVKIIIDYIRREIFLTFLGD